MSNNKKDYSKFINNKGIQFGSITAHNKYGIPRSALTYMMQNQFYFDKAYIDCLSSYYIHQWKCGLFLTTIHEGIIEHWGISYQIIYHKTDPTTIAKIGKQCPAARVKLSFRVAQPEFNVQPTVLVKLYKNLKGEVIR